ncbi:MAG TPA: hypothetical protein VF373_07065, partial [Prolixibacteraceae bacterium]
MKASLLILLLFIQISAFSQSFWSKVIDDQNINKSSFTANTLFQDSLILVGGFVGTASCPGSELFAYNLEGKRVWEKSGYFDVIYSDSNLIYTAGHIWGDDVIGFEQVALAKFDKNGKEIFQTRYPDVPHYYYFDFVPNSMDINKNGTIVVSSKNGIIRVDSLGKVVSETPMKFQDDISSIQFIGNDSLLINTNSTLYKIDTTFTQLDSISFKERNVSALIQNDTIYCLFANKLVILDTNFNILDTLVNSTDIVFEKIKAFSGDLWIQGVKTNQAKILHLHKLKISETLTFDLLMQSPDFLVTSNNVIFTGNSNSGQIAIYSYNKKAESDSVSLPDIEIVDFDIQHIGIDYVHIPGESDIPRGYNFLTDMVLKNNGNDTITSFAIYSYLNGGMNCAHNYYYCKFTDQLLLPNQRLTINLNRIYQDGIYANELCFEVLAPNSLIENNVENNSLCKTFEIVGLKDLADSPLFQVFPNPVKDILNLKMEA